MKQNKKCVIILLKTKPTLPISRRKVSVGQHQRLVEIFNKNIILLLNHVMTKY